MAAVIETENVIMSLSKGLFMIIQCNWLVTESKFVSRNLAVNKTSNSGKTHTNWILAIFLGTDCSSELLYFLSRPGTVHGDYFPRHSKSILVFWVLTAGRFQQLYELKSSGVALWFTICACLCNVTSGENNSPAFLELDHCKNPVSVDFPSTNGGLAFKLSVGLCTGKRTMNQSSLASEL